MGTETKREAEHERSSKNVEKMGPLRGDGNRNFALKMCLFIVEKMGPLRGDGNDNLPMHRAIKFNGREDGSPSWGRKQILFTVSMYFFVEKMGPLRGDGNLFSISVVSQVHKVVEKMGPLRGDGNQYNFSFS